MKFFLEKILRYLIVILNKSLKILGLHLISVKRLHSHQANSIQLYHALLDKIELKQAENSGVTGVIFSKDRPVQLDALLSSFFLYVNKPCSLTVLYKYSDLQSKAGYTDIINMYNKHDVNFIKEENFKSDVINITNSTKEQTIFFLVDDIMFKRPFSLESFTKHDLKKYVPTMRHANHLSKCYTQSATQPLPNDLCINDAEETIEWLWKTGQYDWGYPLSLDGHFFATSEIILMCSIIEYHSPNSLEKALQFFLPVYELRKGIALNESVLVNIPANKVQLDNSNLSANISPSKLLTTWHQGYRIDPKTAEGTLNTSCHYEIGFRWVPRNTDRQNKKVRNVQ